MNYIENLANYLMSIEARNPFHIGDWLDTLSDDEIDGLAQLNLKMEAGNIEAVKTIVVLTACIMSAELKQREVVIDLELMPAIGFLTSICRLAKQGYLRLLSPLTITGELVIAETEKGKQAKYDILFSRDAGIAFH